MPPETQPEKPKEVKKAQSEPSLLENAADFFSKKWDNYWKKERTELKKEVEASRDVIKKDGLEFKEMKFDETGKAKPEQQLQDYVSKIPPLQLGEGRLRADREPELSSGSAGARRRGEATELKIKTATELVAELPESKYTKREKELIGKYVNATIAIESLGKYEVLGVEITQKGNPHFGDRALGKYQPMPKNWMKWSKEIFEGKVVQPDRQAQEYVAFRRFMVNYDELKKAYPNDEYKLFYALASRWIGGGFATEFMGEKIPLGGAETKEYCENAMKKMGLTQPLEEKAKSKAADYTVRSKKTYKKAREWWNKGKDMLGNK